MDEALAMHDACLRAALDQHCGYEVGLSLTYTDSEDGCASQSLHLMSHDKHPHARCHNQIKDFAKACCFAKQVQPLSVSRVANRAYFGI